MEVPRKRAKACPDDGIADGGAESPTAAQQIAELRAELARCKMEHNQVVAELAREKIATAERHDHQVVAEFEREKIAVERHDQVVCNLKRSYSNALNWAYSVETIPRDYWLGKGHTEEYANAMEELLDTFKCNIAVLRTGGTTAQRIADDCILIFDLQDEEGNCITADHDDVLMPYWKELAKALVHWSKYHADENETLMVVVIYVETPDAVLDVLRPAIKQSKVRHLGFVGDGNPKSWKMAEFIEDVLKTNQHVTKLGLTSIMLSNEEWEIIGNAIRIRNAEQTSAMSFFGLTECFVGGVDTETLKGILTSNTEQINLDGNGMSSREAPIIAEILESNPSLDQLTIEKNRFDDADAAVLANPLSSNTNLEALYVSGNAEMRVNGRLAFLRAIFDVSSLASCAASNHTCRVFGFEQDISALNECDDFSTNKWEKIFAMLALSSEDSFFNLALLKDVPVSLMPVLLDQADGQIEEGNSRVTDLYLELTGTKRGQRHDVWDNLEQTRSISCVFELVRSCVVPSLYV